MILTWNFSVTSQTLCGTSEWLPQGRNTLMKEFRQKKGSWGGWENCDGFILSLELIFVQLTPKQQELKALTPLLTVLAGMASDFLNRVV